MAPTILLKRSTAALSVLGDSASTICRSIFSISPWCFRRFRERLSMGSDTGSFLLPAQFEYNQTSSRNQAIGMEKATQKQSTSGVSNTPPLSAPENQQKTQIGNDMTLDINEIHKILPHRPPFLLVDRIVELEPCKRIVGIKNVSMNEPFFVGHFPNFPVMPGVLIIEAMAQTGGGLGLHDAAIGADQVVLFAAIEEAKFRRPVVPGDQLRLGLRGLARA